MGGAKREMKKPEEEHMNPGSWVLFPSHLARKAKAYLPTQKKKYTPGFEDTGVSLLETG